MKAKTNISGRLNRSFIFYLLSFIFFLPACTFVAGNRTTGKFSAVFLGTDADDVNLTPDGFTAKKITNSIAFKDAIKQVRAMWQSYLFAKAIEFVAGKYYDHQGVEVSSAQSVKLEELRNAKDVELAKIKLEELKLMEAPAL